MKVCFLFAKVVKTFPAQILAQDQELDGVYLYRSISKGKNQLMKIVQ